MKVICGIGNLKGGSRRPKALAIGVFDGVHRGHQKILKLLVRASRCQGILSAVLTFQTHPSHAVDQRKKISHLTSLDHKLSLIGRLGVDLCYVLDFNKRFASMSAADFVKDFLLAQLRMVSLYVGEDFVFGYRARGNRALLARLAKKNHFQLNVVDHLKINNKIISSTLIRQLIKQGNLSMVRQCLGHPASLWGHIVRGEGRGRRLGFPTANLKISSEVLLPDGIYATHAACSGRVYPRVTYVGSKPTFHRLRKVRGVEVSIFDLKKDFYGKTMEVYFIKKIRNDRCFDSSEALVSAIKRDTESAKKILKP